MFQYNTCDNTTSTTCAYLSPHQLKNIEEEENAKSKRNLIKLKYLKALQSINISQEEKLRIIQKNLEEISYVYDITKDIHFEDF